ncbi:MAG: nuclear transport factor 2 family protein [Chloroflexi bacterium]|nr:nuclear transport factor 2 family protein [Chloroflexota bacterium]
MDIAKYNAAWLQAWTDKDVAGLLTYYHPQVVYKDAQTAAGITGHEALAAYLTGLFAALPPTRYDPDQVWPIEGGYCGRWIATMELGEGKARHIRGFDLVLMDGDQITLNEVYTHELPG